MKTKLIKQNKDTTKKTNMVQKLILQKEELNRK